MFGFIATVFKQTIVEIRSFHVYSVLSLKKTQKVLVYGELLGGQGSPGSEAGLDQSSDRVLAPLCRAFKINELKTEVTNRLAMLEKRVECE